MDKKEGKEKEISEEVIPKRKTKEIYVILAFMAGLVILFLISVSIFNSLKIFDYEGLTFTKERFGEIPVFHYYYYINNPITGNVIAKYNLYLRNDPRENDVPIEGEIEFLSPQEYHYISVNGTGLEQCPQSSLAIGTLSAFLTNNQLSVKGASPESEIAEKEVVPYITCENTKDRVVILIQSGNETKIERIGKRCHVISVSNCEILEAIEKFEVQSILDARKRAGI